MNHQMSHVKRVSYLAAGALCLLAALIVYSTIWHSELVTYVPGIGNEDDNVEMLDNPRSCAPYTFLVIGDNKNNMEISEQLFMKAKKQGVTFAVNMGDLVADSQRGRWRFALSEYKELNLDFPCFVVPGNHDVMTAGNISWKFYNAAIGPAQRSFVFRNDLFILLNNAVEDLNRIDYSWLEETLERESKARRHIFLFMHNPTLWDHATNKERDMNDPCFSRLHEIVKKYGIDYVLAGHIHSFREKVVDGCRYIVTGGGGAHLVGEESFYHSITLSVSDDGIARDINKIGYTWGLDDEVEELALGMLDHPPMTQFLILGLLPLGAFVLLRKGLRPERRNAFALFRAVFRRYRILVLAIVAIGAMRFISLGPAPLFDTTEGRYAEIAREMAITRDWITPKFDEGEPFWGKPPLHFWITTGAFKLLGFTEFAARMPGFLAALVTLWMMWYMTCRLFGRRSAIYAVFVLSSSVLFFVLAGLVITDMTVAACITGAMMSFSLFAFGESGPRIARRWALLFFAFLGLGMLAKGPVTVAIVIGALSMWLIATRRCSILKRIPWLAGTLLALAICAPWYIAAEIKTPGFLHYFFINEHILRYISKEYGDLYGHGHNVPYGMIWLYGFIGLLPWSPMIIVMVGRALKKRKKETQPINPKTTFLWCWALSPLLFFTLARSVAFYYALPGLPPIAVLIGRFLSGDIMSTQRRAVPILQNMTNVSGRILSATGICFTLLILGAIGLGSGDFSFSFLTLSLSSLCIVVFAFLFLAFRKKKHVLADAVVLALLVPVSAGMFNMVFASQVGLERSTRELAKMLYAEQHINDSKIIFFDDVPYSAEFYLDDMVIGVNENNSQLLSEMSKDGRAYIIVETRDIKDIHRDILPRLSYICSIGPYYVYIT